MIAFLDALTIDDTEPQPIPDPVAIATLMHIAAKQRRDLDNARKIDDLKIVVDAGGQAEQTVAGLEVRS